MKFSLLVSISIVGSLAFVLLFGKERASASGAPAQVPLPAQPREEPFYRLGLLGAGTKYETPYYCFDSGVQGPAVLVEAGIHGDEPAGALALDQLWPRLEVRAGKLIILPRMNIPACREQRRFLNVDLNRVFGKAVDTTAYEYRLAAEISDLVGAERIEYLLTLHESRYLHQPGKNRSYGQTIVYGVDLPPACLAPWLERINALVEAEEERFHPFYDPVDGSSTETLVAQYALKGGFCVETWRSFAMDKRIELHTKGVLSFLETVGLSYTLLPDTAID